MLFALVHNSVHAAPTPAGRVEFAIGSPMASGTDNRARPLTKGALVYEGDMIHTGAGRVQVRFSDGGFMSLQPQTQFKVEQYRFAGKQEGNEKGIFNLVTGGVRTITGLIGKQDPKNYRMRTRVATIGVRGTEFSLSMDTALHGNVASGQIDVCNAGGCAPFGQGESFAVAHANARPTMTFRKADLPAPNLSEQRAREEESSKSENQKASASSTATAPPQPTGQADIAGKQPAGTAPPQVATSQTSVGEKTVVPPADMSPKAAPTNTAGMPMDGKATDLTAVNIPATTTGQGPGVPMDPGSSPLVTSGTLPPTPDSGGFIQGNANSLTAGPVTPLLTGTHFLGIARAIGSVTGPIYGLQPPTLGTVTFDNNGIAQVIQGTALLGAVGGSVGVSATGRGINGVTGLPFHWAAGYPTLNGDIQWLKTNVPIATYSGIDSKGPTGFFGNAFPPPGETVIGNFVSGSMTMNFLTNAASLNLNLQIANQPLSVTVPSLTILSATTTTPQTAFTGTCTLNANCVVHGFFIGPKAAHAGVVYGFGNVPILDTTGNPSTVTAHGAAMLQKIP